MSLFFPAPIGLLFLTYLYTQGIGRRKATAFAPRNTSERPLDKYSAFQVTPSVSASTNPSPTGAIHMVGEATPLVISYGPETKIF